MSDKVKLTKSDVKTPDKVLQELQKGFQWTAEHSQLVLLGIGVFVVIGAGLSAKTYFDQKSENEIQTQYFKIEKSFLEKKQSFAAAAEPPALKGEKKPEITSEKATGDLQKDYGTISDDFLKIIERSPKSKAAKMAALNLSDLQSEYKKMDEARNTLSKVSTDSGDLLSALVLVQLGTLQADQKDCSGAISTWQKVLSRSEAKSLFSAVRLKQGLCFEALNDSGKAQQLYAQIKEEDKESASARSADKYLRLLQVQK